MVVSLDRQRRPNSGRTAKSLIAVVRRPQVIENVHDPWHRVQDDSFQFQAVGYVMYGRVNESNRPEPAKGNPTTRSPDLLQSGHRDRANLLREISTAVASEGLAAQNTKN
jgi:hypothetical protein